MNDFDVIAIILVIGTALMLVLTFNKHIFNDGIGRVIHGDMRTLAMWLFGSSLLSLGAMFEWNRGHDWAGDVYIAGAIGAVLFWVRPAWRILKNLPF
jgi:hypothetical protein